MPEHYEGVGLGERASLSFLRGDERVKYLKAQGYRVQGQKTTGKLRLISADGDTLVTDPEGLDVGDFFDFLGFVPEVGLGTVGAIGGGILGSGAGPLGTVLGGVAGAGGLSAAGEFARQGVAAHILDDPQYSTADFGRAAEAGAVGAAAEFTAGPLGALAGYGLKTILKPFAKVFKNRVGAVGRETVERAGRLGIEPEQLPASAVTQSPLVRAGEQYARESPATSDIIAREVDEPLEKALGESFGSLRSRMGGGVPETAVRETAIEPVLVQKGLIETASEARDLTSKAIGGAWDEFAMAANPDQVPATRGALDALLQEWNSVIGRNPAALEGIEFERVAKVISGARVNTLAELDLLRRDIGRLMDSPTLERPARRAYRAVMDDLDSSVQAIGQAAPEAAGKYQRYLDLASRQFEIADSPLVKQLFPDGEPNVYALSDAVDKVFRNGNVEAIRAFKQRIGVLPQQGPAGSGGEGALREFADVMKGREGRAAIEMPQTEKGEFVFDQMKQLYLDDILARVAKSADPNEIGKSGTRLWNELFLTGRKREVSREIFGAVTDDLENFVRLLMDSHVSQRFFANFSRTSIRNEFAEFMRHPIRQAIRHPLSRAAAGQLARNQPDVLLGRQFLIHGELPNISQYLKVLRSRASRLVPGATRGQVRSASRQTLARVLPQVLNPKEF